MKSFATCGAVLCSLVLSFAVVGCNSAPQGEDAGKTAEELNTTDSKAELKQRLEEVAESGAAGSELAGMRESIEQLRGTDAALTDELLKSLDQLEQGGSPAQVKKIASGMASKL